MSFQVKQTMEYRAGKEIYKIWIKTLDIADTMLGKSLYGNEIMPTCTENYLKQQYLRRVDQYNERWDNLNKKPEMKEILKSMNEAEQHEEKEREEQKRLTSWDYIRRGNRAYSKENYKEAIDAYTEAIRLNSDYAGVYNNRGNTYDRQGEYEKAIALKPDYKESYLNRAEAYRAIGETALAEQDEEYAAGIETK